MTLIGLIPHAGSMCLLDRVVAHSAHDIQCATRTHTDPGHPLRRDGQLSAVHLIEYAAQAMAAHGALVSGGLQPGMLASVRDIRLHVERIDDLDTELMIHATRRLAQSAGSLYDFTVHGSGRLLCEGRIAIVLLLAAALPGDLLGHLPPEGHGSR
jgi:predicted hotdog family 3-hydroxylacyl-ACP dehydratase